MSNLSQFQQKLINDLTNEFKKLNPQSKDKTGVKRFGLSSIDNCINEEEKFKQTVAKHNLTMLKVFINQFKEELKEFKKEFGKVLDFQIGYPSHLNYVDNHTIEDIEKYVKQFPLNVSTSKQLYLFLVSKTKVYDRGDSRWNYCNSKKYQQIYVNFKMEKVIVALESGKEVTLYKIAGLNYSNYDYLSSSHYKVDSSTLDGLVQSHKSIQQDIVDLVK